MTKEKKTLNKKHWHEIVFLQPDGTRTTILTGTANRVMPNKRLDSLMRKELIHPDSLIIDGGYIFFGTRDERDKFISSGKWEHKKDIMAMGQAWKEQNMALVDEWDEVVDNALNSLEGKAK